MLSRRRRPPLFVSSSNRHNINIIIIKLLTVIFAVFDKDRSGFASSSEIKTVMANLGVHFSDEEIQEMMIEVSLIDFLRFFAFNI